jgi:hypothetical protein
MIAGYMITYRRAFKAGDRVKIGDMIGDIIETRLQVTHLRSFKNEELVIPNSLILSSQVLNYSSLAGTEGLILHTEVGIGYETPWRQVEALLIAAPSGRLMAQNLPTVHLKELGDFAIIYELNVLPRCPRDATTLRRAIATFSTCSTGRRRSRRRDTSAILPDRGRGPGLVSSLRRGRRPTSTAICLFRNIMDWREMGNDPVHVIVIAVTASIRPSPFSFGFIRISINVNG